MEMHAIGPDGSMLKISIQQSTRPASEILGGIIPPSPMFLGTMRKGAGLFVVDNSEKMIAFKMRSLDIITRYRIAGESIDDRFITPSWGGLGVRTKMVWSPPHGFEILLVVIADKTGILGQRLLLSGPNGMVYVMPIKNVSQPCGSICTGVEYKFSDHCYGGGNLDKIMDAPRFLNSTDWNSDLGYLSQAKYEQFFRWDIRGRQQPIDTESFTDSLKIYKQSGDSFVPSFVIRKMVQEEYYD